MHMLFCVLLLILMILLTNINWVDCPWIINSLLFQGRGGGDGSHSNGFVFVVFVYKGRLLLSCENKHIPRRMVSTSVSVCCRGRRLGLRLLLPINAVEIQSGELIIPSSHSNCHNHPDRGRD